MEIYQLQIPDPSGILTGLEGLAADHPCCLLYSGGTRDSAERSFFAIYPVETVTIGGSHPWEELKAALGPLNADSNLPRYFGYLSYEMGAYADPEKRLVHDDASIPLAQFSRYGAVLEWRPDGQARLCIEKGAVPQSLGTPEAWLEVFEKGRDVNVIGRCEVRLDQQSDELEPYLEKIACAKEHILSGDIYQINLSQEFTLQGSYCPYGIFRGIAERNPASFSAYIRSEDFAIISSSPERFLSRKGEQLETRPIKGTSPRGATSDEDLRLQQELMACPKNRAELLMITDLMRNDLSRVSVPGTVDTRELYRCESYQNVFHLLSRIESQVQRGLHSVDILRACFPGGSITGCPKLRSMEIIQALEARPRGIYTGSIGYFRGNGDFDFNIAIRTLLAEKDQLKVAVGGAITADSNPYSEWNETLYKGRSIFEVLGCDEVFMEELACHTSA